MLRSRSLLSTLIALLALIFPAWVMANNAAIPLYGLFEKSITNTQNYRNPFSDTKLIVEYIAPSGRKIVFPGYYDGDGAGGQNGDIWKFRFMPDEPGVWNYRYTWSDGSTGGSGIFHCSNSDARPGPWRIHPDNGHWFTDSHGTPFLPVAVYATAHLTPVDWNDALAWAKQKGFNTIVTPTFNTTVWADGWHNTTAFTSRNGDDSLARSGTLKQIDPSRYNLKMWREWDQMIQAAGDAGIYVAPFEGPSGKYGGQDGKYPPDPLVFTPKIRDRFDTKRNKQFIRYLIARQGAFWNLAYWNLGSTEAYQYAVKDEGEFQHYLRHMAELTPWNRLITAQDVEQWHNKERRWLSRSKLSPDRKLNTIQTAVASSAYPSWGRSNIDNRYWQSTRPNHELAMDSYHGFPILCTECLWEGQGRAENPTNLIWGMLTAGAHTVWADWRYADKGTQQEHRWGSIGKAWIPVKPLEERVFTASRFGSNTQGDELLVHAAKILSGFAYWKMEPRNDLITNDTEAYCLAAPGEAYLIYLPDGGPIELELTGGPFEYQWIDPKSAQVLSRGRLGTAELVKLDFPSKKSRLLSVKKIPLGR